MHTDPLKLRLQIDQLLKDPTPKNYCSILKKIKFAIQIIENHKIVNFKEANPERKIILESPDPDNILLEYIFCLSKPLELLKNSTDGMLKKEVQSKIIQK